MDGLDFKGGLVGDFKSSPSVKQLLLKPKCGDVEQQQQVADEEQRPFISKSPSNSSFGFDNTFRVLESQVSRDEELLPDNNPPIVTTLELELGAVARLQQFNYYSTPKNKCAAPAPVVARGRAATRPEDCDKYLEFLNQFIRKSRQKVPSDKRGAGGAGGGVSCDKISITVGGDDEEEVDPGLVEFGEYPELVYCIAKDKSGRYRLQNKDRVKSPQRTNNEGKMGIEWKTV